MIAGNLMAPRKAQTTLSGYLGWLYDRLIEREGVPESELFRRILHEWSEANEEKLERWGLSSEDWRQQVGGNVVPIRERLKGEG